MKRCIIAFCLVLMIAAGAFSQTQNPAVVASTAWVAAFVKTAGIDEITILAPFELKHPPEYELKPSDIVAVSKATHIVYAGYEKMVEKLKENAGKTAVLTAITTQNDPESIRKGVLSLAKIFKTEKKAEENLKKIDAFFDDWKKELKISGLYGRPVLCHIHQKPLIGALDFVIAKTFGPAPLEAKQILDLSGQKATLVIDNYHNPVASPLSDAIQGAVIAVFINFPSDKTKNDLLSILKMNRDIFNITVKAAE